MELKDYYNSDRKKIFISGYPKSGNSWLWILLSDLLDSPFQPPVLDDKIIPAYFSSLNKEDSGKCVIIKTHFPFDKELPQYHLLDKRIIEDIYNNNVICILRDPRSVMCSAMHFNAIDENTSGIIECIKKHFYNDYYYKNNITMYEQWNRSYYNNIPCIKYITTYEKMKMQPEQELKNICDSLNINITEDKIKKTLYDQSFENLKNNNNFFFWKGKMDSWKEYFNKEAGRLITECLGDFMLDFGYIDSLYWWESLPE